MVERVFAEKPLGPFRVDGQETRNQRVGGGGADVGLGREKSQRSSPDDPRNRGGVAGALALPSAIAAQLYGVGPLDPAVMLGAVAVLAGTSFIACLGPARRASRVSPIVALSHH